MKTYQANLLLLLVTIIWGLAFPIAKILLNLHISAGFIVFCRGMLFTLFIFVLYHKKILKMTKHQFKVGFIAGITNFASFYLQIIGQKYTLSSHSSILTVTYVLIVPLIMLLFYKRKIAKKTIIAVFMCFIGIVMLVSTNFQMITNFTQLLGDMLTILCAVLFAISMVYIGENCKDVSFETTSFMIASTFAVCGFIAFLFEGLTIQTEKVEINYLLLIGCILYLGLLSSAVCQTLQVICQKYTSSVSASIIFSMEGLFGSLFSMFLLHELPTLLFIIGTVFIVLSILINEVNLSLIINKRRKKF